METKKSNKNQVYFKRFWWVVLILSFAEVFSDGYIGLKEGFDWSFIDQPKSHLKLLFYIICWTVGYYLLFLKSNPKKHARENQSLESNDLLGESSSRN